MMQRCRTDSQAVVPLPDIQLRSADSGREPQRKQPVSPLRNLWRLDRSDGGLSRSSSTSSAASASMHALAAPLFV